ncbi:hypothetical protein P7K49_035428 [Saguinus oedipus]|uniref:Uncharacterized protein n=1 Tax=Saguinus oedipus TaxID=9490 RepID=A0ABQ9TNJ7_SAGOE|nr:hypothetical protein P7K49_035428 [Saguinus oedipus]
MQPSTQNPGSGRHFYYLAKDVFNVISTQLMSLQIKVFHDVPIPGSDAAVLVRVTAAEGLTVRAKLKVQKGPERGPIIQALGVSLKQAHLAQQECETEAENARREPGGPATQTAAQTRSGRSQHFGLGNTRAAVFAQVGFPALPKVLPLFLPPLHPVFPSLLLFPSSPAEVVSEQCPFCGLPLKTVRGVPSPFLNPSKQEAPL